MLTITGRMKTDRGRTFRRSLMAEVRGAPGAALAQPRTGLGRLGPPQEGLGLLCVGRVVWLRRGEALGAWVFLGRVPYS